jgi:D-alanine-D-alanine ligase
MNKVVMKDVFKSLQIPLVKYLVFTKENYESKKVVSELSFPVIVKPANLGSSIGISKVESEDDLQDAVDVALHYDSYIMIEKCVQNLKELNCSVSEVK